MLSKAQIKTIHSLRYKKSRQKSGHFIAEGAKVIAELLQEDYIQVEGLLALDSWIAGYTPVEKKASLKITRISEQELKQISALDTPQQVVAVCRLPVPEQVPLLNGKVTLMLESVRDPGNLGTIIRIADWFGIERIICSTDCADTFNPKTVQATMGSIARVKVSESPLEMIIARNKAVPVYAATLHGQSITRVSPLKEGILLIGNESNGLSEQLIKTATQCITIPRIGKAESLNAAVATGIICSRLLLPAE
jgi:TrmH family RNA methyltransferase